MEDFQKIVFRLYALFFLLCLYIARIEGRTLTTEVNPGCLNHTECTTGVNGTYANLVYTKAVGKTDTLHYLYSTIGVPTALIVRTSDDKANLEINWDNLLSKEQDKIKNSIRFTGSNVLYSYGKVFTKLYEYNDTSDSADMGSYTFNSTSWKVHDFRMFTWDKSAMYSDTENNIAVFNISYDMMSEYDNGTIYFKFQAFANDNRPGDLPHLEYNENITKFDMAIKNIPAAFTDSRFASEFALISDGPSNKVSVDDDKSLDDEYCPGIFKIYNVILQNNNADQSGYMQYKPVCYQDVTRTRSDQTSTKNYDMLNNTHTLNDSLEVGIAYAFYGDRLFDGSLSMSSTNISYGIGGDKMYTKNNYTSWTGTLGYGTPPVDSISVMIIAIISAGLGIPAILIIFGAFFLCVKNKKDKNAIYEVTSSYPVVN